MKWVTYSRLGGELRVGALLDEEVGDLQSMAAVYLREMEKEKEPLASARQRVPGGMIPFLAQGEESASLARRAVEYCLQRRRAEKKGNEGPDGESLLFPLGEVVLHAPVPRPGKIIAMGLNFADHARENKVPVPEIPVGFLKAATSVVGPGAPVPYPRATKELDYEIELAIVIGKKGRDIPAEKAMEYVAGYTILNDLSARDIQAREMKKRLVLLSKSLDATGPMGPCLVTRDEIPDPHDLAMELRVNQEPEPRQKSSTREMIFKVPELIAYWSQMTLEPGDVISSGTPGGVALFRENPEKWFLKPGDLVEARIEGLGVLRNRIIES